LLEKLSFAEVSGSYQDPNGRTQAARRGNGGGTLRRLGKREDEMGGTPHPGLLE
jgi:hypothetical protein